MSIRRRIKNAGARRRASGVTCPVQSCRDPICDRPVQEGKFGFVHLIRSVGAGRGA